MVVMNGRFCDKCGAKMSPYMPRTRSGDGRSMWCPMCALNEGKAMRVAVRIKQDPPAGGIRSFAHFIAADKPDVVPMIPPRLPAKQAHNSGDGVTIFHCPFCGSGQVIARSDGTVNCQFCNTTFTVQVQPEFSAFPQTINGVPVQIPGMPPDTGEPDAGMPPGAEGDDGENMPPGADEDADGDGVPDEDEGDDEEDSSAAPPPFTKKSYRADGGYLLDGKHFMQHLALKHMKTGEVLGKIRAENFGG